MCARIDIVVLLAPLLSHADASLRGKACNVIGNLCRHNASFYPQMSQYARPHFVLVVCVLMPLCVCLFVLVFAPFVCAGRVLPRNWCCVAATVSPPCASSQPLSSNAAFPRTRSTSHCARLSFACLAAGRLHGREDARQRRRCAGQPCAQQRTAL